MKIRAHHLLCMQGFQGYGYSEDFTKNMAHVIQTLKNFPESKIEIISGNDIICTCCPHNIDSICQENLKSPENIIAMDNKVLEKLRIPSGSIFKAGNIFKIVNEELTHPDVMDICGDCRWSKKCLWLISKSK